MEVHQFKQVVTRKICPTCGQEFSLSDEEISCPKDGAMLAPLMDDPFIGQTIADNVEILKDIGSGASGTVYKAKQNPLGRMVAVKILQTQLVSDLEKVRRFEREAKAVSMLVHPNVVSLFDYGLLPRPYMVMEYVDGRKLEDICKEEHLSFHAAIRIGTQICDALEAAHQLGIIHRDLKPANIMISGRDEEEYVVKILDFGLAKLVQESETDAPALTKTGDIIGSPPYMSPEQCLGKTPDHRSDIYSLGCMMYEFFTGQRPFVCNSAADYMTKHTMEDPKAFLDVNPKLILPQIVEDVVLKALEKDPARRQQTMAEFKNDLEKCFTTATLSGIKTLKKKKAKRKIHKLRLIAMLATAGIAGGGFFLWQCFPHYIPNMLWEHAFNSGSKALKDRDFPFAESQLKKAADMSKSFGTKDHRYFSSLEQLLQTLISESKLDEASQINEKLLEISAIENKKRRYGGSTGRNGIAFLYPSKWYMQPGDIDWNDAGKFKPAHTIRPGLLYLQIYQDNISPQELADLEQKIYEKLCSGYKLTSTSSSKIGSNANLDALIKDFEVSGDFGITRLIKQAHKKGEKAIPETLMLKTWETGDKIIHKDVYFGAPGRIFKLRIQGSAVDIAHLKRSLDAILATIELYPDQTLSTVVNRIDLSNSEYYTQGSGANPQVICLVPKGSKVPPGFSASWAPYSLESNQEKQK